MKKRSLGAPRLPSLHEFQAPREVSVQTKLRLQKSPRLLQPLDIPSDLPWRILCARGRQSQAHNVQHAVVEPVVELGPTARVGVVVPALIAAVRVQVPAELDDELECERRAARQGGEVFDGRNELREGAGECGCGQVGGERVLEAMQVVVEHGHFAIELVVEGLCGGGVAVHRIRNGWRYV